MAEVQIYSTASCPYCVQAKKLLESKGVAYTELRIDESDELMQEMLTRSNGRRTVPQIFINGKHVGGFDDLSALEHAGSLDKLLNT